MKKSNWPKIMLRFPPDLKAFVQNEAHANGSSINSEIIRCVRERVNILGKKGPHYACSEKKGGHNAEQS